MKRIINICLILLVSGHLSAQNTLRLAIDHKLDNSDFAFNTQQKNDLGNDYKLTRLEYYISGITITHDGGQTTAASSVYILANANSNDTFDLGSHNITSVEAINFSIGVDPSQNNADPSKWPSDHALAPKSPSMHWGWSAGYRFVALEGKSGSSLNRDMQIHALGNKNYFEQSIPVSASVVNGELVISLIADYNKALSNIDVSAGIFEHSDKAEAAECLRNFQLKVFTNMNGEGNTLSVKEEQSFGLKIYPNPSNGSVRLALSDQRLTGGSVTVQNTLGEVVEESQLIGNSSTLLIEQSGLYMITVRNNGIVASQKLIVN